MNEPKLIGDISRQIAEDPTDPWLYDDRGWEYMHLRRYSEALQDFDRAIELDPSDGEFHLDRGRVLLRLERLTDARRALDKALAIDPSLAEAFRARMAVAFQEKDYQGALTDIERAVELAPDDAGYHHLLARMLATLKRPDDALQAISEAIRLEPEDAARYSFRFYLYIYDLVCESPASALEDASRALKLSGDKSPVLFGRGLIYFSERRWADAAENFARDYACKTRASTRERSLVFLCISMQNQGVSATEIPQLADYLRSQLERGWFPGCGTDCWPFRAAWMFSGEIAPAEVERGLKEDVEASDQERGESLFEFHLILALWKSAARDASFETDVRRCRELAQFCWIKFYSKILDTYFA